MALRFAKVLLVATSALFLLGCKPTPVVVNPNGEDDATVVEESDVEIQHKDDAMPPPDPGTDVKVDVGGGEGVNVDVDRKDESNP